MHLRLTRVGGLAFLALAIVGCDAAPILVDASADAANDGSTPTLERAWIQDEAGGVLILRGTNVEGASKWAPDFLPPSYVVSHDFRRLRVELGMNAVRFLVFWEAVEPAPGAYDAAYLAAVRARVDAAGEAGLRVIVDMHQDVFGRGFGNDGAPRWACDESLYASFTAPAEWFLGYAEPEVQECFDRLWMDPALRAAYGAAWAAVADALRGADAAIAYELMNEPHWGTSSVRGFERDVAPLAYAEWADAIRAVDPGPYVMMDPASAANVGLSSFLVPPARERLIYGPHLYPPSLERGLGWTGSDATVAALTATIVEDAARMTLPAVIGETGARADVAGALTFLDQVYDAFDRDRLSATQWEGGTGGEGSYALFGPDGAPSAIARAIARPHPARTAGVPLEWSWNASARRFELRWDEGASPTGETRVTLPTVAFPDGATVMVEDGGEARVEDATVIVPSRGGIRHLSIAP